MAGQINALVLDLVEWVAKQPRPYAEVMDAWRTSCPRLTIFEDAVDGGLIESRTVPGGGVLVVATDAGTAMLREHGRGQHAVHTNSAHLSPWGEVGTRERSG